MPTPTPRWGCAPPHLHCPKGDPERRRRRDRTPTPSSPSKFSPPQTQTLSETQKARRTNVPGSRKRGGKWSAFPPKANAEGIRVAGNQSCRAPSRGLGVGSRILAASRGRKEAPGARRARWPCREQVVRRLRSRPHGSNFPTAWRVDGSEKAREAGREGAVRGSGYRVHVPRGAAPGLCSPPDRPRKAACSSTDHRRVSPPVRRLIRGALAAPGSPSAVRSLLAACRPQLQTRRGLRRGAPQSPRSPAPWRPMPRAGPPSPAGISARQPSDASSHRASRSQPAPLFPEPPPRLKSAINFPSLPPPCSAPATQTPPPDAPSLTSASPSPCPPRRAPPPTLPPRWAPGSLSPPPLTPLGPPGAARSRGQALRA